MGRYALVASPGRAALMQLSALHSEESFVKVYGSNAVINDLLAIAPAALVAALSPEPEIETSKAATLAHGYRAAAGRHDGSELARCFKRTASRSRCAGRSLGRCAIREASHG